jgi:hypothetical protein
MFRFTIRDVLWLMVVVGVSFGWLVDGITVRRKATVRIEAAELETDTLHDEYVDLMNAIHDAGVRYHKQPNGRYSVNVLRNRSGEKPQENPGRQIGGRLTPPPP